MYANLSRLVATPNRLLASWTSKKDFNVHHVVHLYTLWVIVLRTVKYQVARLQLVLLELFRATVELIPLISASKYEAKLNTKVLHCARHQRAAVKKKRCVVVRIIRVEVPFRVWDPYVLLTLLHESISEPLLVLWASVTNSVPLASKHIA